MSPAAPRILRLGELLTTPVPDVYDEVVAAKPTRPDPLAELEATRTRVLAEAREAGLAAGRRDAQAEIDRAIAAHREEVAQRHASLERELQRATERLVELARSIRAELDRQDAECVDAACTLAMTALTRIAGQGFARGTLVPEICRTLLAEIKARPATLRVAPVDEAAVRAALQGTDVEIVADAAVVAGGCRMDSARGRVETSLAQRLHAIADALSLGEGAP